MRVIAFFWSKWVWFRKGINCHSRCTFNCKDIENLISVPNMIRYELLMNYKFLAQYNAHMCSKHVGITNYWSLIKQVSQEVSVEEQRIVSDLTMNTIKNWKTTNLYSILIKLILWTMRHLNMVFLRQKFQQICCFIKTYEPKHVAVFLCKLRTALSNN